MLSSNVSFAWIGTQIEGENSLFPGSGGFNIETFTNIVKIFLIFITILLDNDLLWHTLNFTGFHNWQKIVDSTVIIGQKKIMNQVCLSLYYASIAVYNECSSVLWQHYNLLGACQRSNTTNILYSFQKWCQFFLLRLNPEKNLSTMMIGSWNRMITNPLSVEVSKPFSVPKSVTTSTGQPPRSLTAST